MVRRDILDVSVYEPKIKDLFIVSLGGKQIRLVTVKDENSCVKECDKCWFFKQGINCERFSCFKKIRKDKKSVHFVAARLSSAVVKKLVELDSFDLQNGKPIRVKVDRKTHIVIKPVASNKAYDCTRCCFLHNGCSQCVCDGDLRKDKLNVVFKKKGEKDG